jgi:trigger factor
VKKYPIDLPQSYIDANAEARLSDYLQQLERQQHSYSEEDYQRIQKSIEESAIFHLQLFFLLRKIASDYHITVDQQDVSQEASRQVALIPSGRSHVNFNDREKLHEQLYHLALDRKIKQFLIDHISFKD